MIDEEKINKAAIECADEYFSMNLGLDREETNREIFTRGAKWAQQEFIKTLWHDTSEEPKRYDDYIVKTKQGCFGSAFFDINGWHRVRDCDGEVVEWCDYEDILPKEGGEE